METKRLLFFIIPFLFDYAFSQKTFEKTYGNGRDCQFFSAIEINNQIVISGSRANPNGIQTTSSDFMLMTIDACSGEEVYSLSDAPNNQRRAAYTILKETPAGGYYAVGNVNTTGPAYDNSVVDEYDANGNRIGRYIFDDLLGRDNEVQDFLVVNNNEFAFVGNTNRTWFFSSFSQYNKTTNTFTNNYAAQIPTRHFIYKAVVPAHGGGYMIAGYNTSNFFTNDAIVLKKVDQAGNTQWFKNTNNGLGQCLVENIVQTNDGYILCGRTNGYGAGNWDIFIQRIDSLGNSIWFKTYGGANSDRPWDMKILNGEITVVGETSSFGAGGIDGLFFKVDLNGNITNQLTFGGAGNDYLKTMVSTNNSLFLIGESGSNGPSRDLYVVKTDSVASVTCSAAPVNLITQNFIRNFVNSVENVAGGLVTTTANFANMPVTNSMNAICNSATLAVLVEGPDTVCPNQQNVAFNVVYDTSFYDSVHWTLYNGATSIGALNNDSIQVNFNGIADSLSVEFFSFCDTFEVKKYLVSSATNLNIGPDTSICEGSTISLSAPIGFTTYNWNTGSTNQSIIINDSGYYHVSVDMGGCIFEDSIYVDLLIRPIIDLGSDTLLCDNDQIILSGGNYNSFRWQNGSTQPTFSVSNQGTYWVIVNENTCPGSDTIYVSYENSPVIDLGPDLYVCGTNQLVNLSINGQHNEYSWSTGSTSTNIDVGIDGMYSVRVNSSTCPAVDSIQVVFIDIPSLDLGEDTLLLCGDNSLVLNPFMTMPTGYNFIWQDGSNGLKYNALDAGYYHLTLQSTQGNCVVSDTVFVDFDCQVYVPNTITPNGDGMNDFFSINFYNINFEEFELLIFDRWGKLIYEFKDQNDSWDGQINDKTARDGVYVYKLAYKRFGERNSERKVTHGNINVLR